MYLKERRAYVGSVGKSGDKVRMRPARYRGGPGLLNLRPPVVGGAGPRQSAYKKAGPAPVLNRPSN